MCISVHESDKTCDIGPPIGPRLREQKQRLVQSIHRLALDRVQHVGSVVCTPHEVKMAAYLAAERFAGARPDADTRPGWTRLGVARSEIIGKALRSKAFIARSDGGASTARKGVKWMLKFGKPIFLAKMNKLLAAAGQTPISPPSFYELVSGPEYEQLTPDKCCCSSCRDLGFLGFELLRQIVCDVAPSIGDSATGTVTALLGCIDEEERYRCSEFLGHLKEEDSCPMHCLRLMCSPFNEADFRCDCTHKRSDGTHRTPPPTMDQQHADRAVRSDDWDDACCLCYDESETSQCLMCAYCANVAHKKCIKCALGNDLPDTTSEWTCPSCVAEHDTIAHDERCLKCEMFFHLIADIEDFCQLALIASKQKQLPMDAPTWAVAKLKFVEKDLLAYFAHLIRDKNQGMFQHWCFGVVEKSPTAWTDLMDYWAKQGALKQKHATCELIANKGVSCHGRMYTFKNPSQDVRDAHPLVPWKKSYPVTLEEGGPALCREFRRSWSDGSRQTAFDTGATMLAEDIEFKATHPWLAADGHVGNMSDGASNYSSTHSVLYYLLNPHLNAKCISVEGMGKDEIDRDNGSEQGKLRTARANSDLTFTGQYIKACNARRHKGVINARVELDTSLDITSAEKKKYQAINRIGELKLHDTRSASQLRSWELFSRKLSEAAGCRSSCGLWTRTCLQPRSATREACP